MLILCIFFPVTRCCDKIMQVQSKCALFLSVLDAKSPLMDSFKIQNVSNIQVIQSCSNEYKQYNTSSPQYFEMYSDFCRTNAIYPEIQPGPS